MKKLNKEEQYIYNAILADHKNDIKYVDFLFKSSYYVLIGEKIVQVCDKPSIAKTIWYDDTTEKPEVNKETFINYNMRSIAYEVEYYLGEGKDDTLILSDLYRNSNVFKYIRSLERTLRTLPFEDLSNEYVVKENEKPLIINKLKEAKEDYLKRLEAYWKRYSQNVSTYGYWADR